MYLLTHTTMQIIKYVLYFNEQYLTICYFVNVSQSHIKFQLSMSIVYDKGAVLYCQYKIKGYHLNVICNNSTVVKAIMKCYHTYIYRVYQKKSPRFLKPYFAKVCEVRWLNVILQSRHVS